MTLKNRAKAVREILALALSALWGLLGLSLSAAEGPAEFRPGVWKTFAYEPAEMTNAPIVFTGWAKADAKDVADFCIWLDIYYRNGEKTFGRRAYFDREVKDWQQARGVFKPAYPVKRIVVNALFRGNQWNRKAKPEGSCSFRDFALERRAGTNEDFVVMRYSNRPFANTIAEFTDHFDGEKVTSSVRTIPHEDEMTSSLADGECRIWAAHSMRKVTPLTFPTGADDEKSVSMLLSRNERESAQVLVSMPRNREWTACELELPTLRLEDGTALKGDFKWERQGYLAREPGFSPHPCAIPDHERWFPEVLLPAAPMRVRACSTQGAWLTVYAASDALPGVYRGEVVVKEKGVEQGRIPLRVDVAPVVIPHRFTLPNAFALMDCHTRRVYGDDWRKFRREAQDIMLDHRLNPDDISRTELPEIEDLLHARERGMNCFNLLNVVPPPKKPTEMVLVCKPKDVFNENYYRYFFGKVKPFVEELKRHGLDRDAYVYGFDERGPDFYEGIREFWERMQKEIPGIPLMNTAKNYVDYAKGKRKGDESLLMGDWYCPVTWDHDFAVSEEIRRKTGKKVWWYVCCGPRFCDYESNPVERRIFGLETWQVKADGYLYWMMNYWTKPFRLSEDDTYFPEYRTGHWAGHAGGGMMLFPGEKHVLPTIRLAQIRDGMEDYEHAVLHDRAFGREATLKLVGRVSQFPGTGNLPGREASYDADPATLAGVRREMLKNLSAADKAHLLILHLDFNSIQMKKETVVEHLRTAAAAGYNAVLWELENKVRWETCPECVHPEAFTKAEFRGILHEADRLGLKPIPLLQTFGHAEYVLDCEKWRGLNEDPEVRTCYCVSRPEVRAFLKRLVREYLELFEGRVEDFHLGGDEARRFGTCPVCSKRDRLDLYVEHLNEIAAVLRERGVRPGIWCDMILTNNGRDQVGRFPKDITAWYWDYYYGFKGGRNATLWADKVNLLIETGFPIIFAPAAQSCGDSPFLPLYERHSANVMESADFARARNLRGLCVTSWSVHLYPKRTQYALWDLAAKRYRNPGASQTEDYAAAVRRRFGPVDVASLERLTRWDFRLQNFDCRFGDNSEKFSKPMPSGSALKKVAYNERKYESYRAPDADEIAAQGREVSAALGRLERIEKPSRELAALIEGGRLAARHFAALEELRRTGRRPSALPEADTRAYYSHEQTPESAGNSTRLVWDPL